MMIAWAYRNDSTTLVEGDWFEQRFQRAKLLVPDAGFDTIIRVEFADTITSELVDVIGVASADGPGQVAGGAVQVNAGDDVIALSQARLQLTGSGSHVARLNLPWYFAALGRYIAPLDVPQLGDTGVDMMALWGDDDNRVTIGVLGNASGGSTSQWVGRVDNDASNFTTLGPALDPDEAPVWHLFEGYTDGDTFVAFAVDGTPFDDTIDAANLPALSAKIGPIVQRTAVGDQAVAVWDKMCVVMASPTVGEP